MMIVYDQENCTIELLNDQGILIQHWYGFSSPENFRSALCFTAETFENNNSLKYLISDTLKQKAVTPEDTDWAATEINPRLLEAGMKKMAFIMPESIITKFGTDNFQDKNEAPFELTYCKTVDEAINWINQ